MEFSGHEMRTKAFFICCEVHAEHFMMLKDLHPEFQPQDTLKQIGVEVSRHRKLQQILEELSTENYFGYASLFFIIEFLCFCDVDFVLARLYRVFNRNERLKYLTKVVLSHSHFNLESTETHLMVKCDKAGKYLRFKLPTAEKIHKSLPNLNTDAFQLMKETPAFVMLNIFTKSDKIRAEIVNRLRKAINLETPHVDNLIVVHCKKFVFIIDYSTYLSHLSRAFYNYLLEFVQSKSVQEIAVNVVNELGNAASAMMSYEEIASFSSTTADGCYVYNINPALAIILNHSSFVGLESRAGASLNDLENLRRTFTSKRIPHLVLTDGSAQDVHNIMSEVKSFNFRGLKYLLLIIMSHGKDGYDIHTKTVPYNIYADIVTPLMANASLQDVQIFALINACRGDFDPYLDDGELPLQLSDVAVVKSMETTERDLVLMFSTQNGCVSLRLDEAGDFYGSLCVQMFCEVFLEPFNEMTTEDIFVKTKSLMDETGYLQVPDYCSNPGRVHNIKMEFKNIEEYRNILQKWDFFAKLYTGAVEDDAAETIEELNEL